ncbi:MAG: UDP-N-acetylmuramoyl-L-alanine--D-glutamate ligase [Christensenellales bacterium]
MHKSFLIWGFASSGEAGFDLLYNQKDKFFVFDSDKDIQQRLISKFSSWKNVFVLTSINKDVIDGMDSIVISPAVTIFDKNICYAKTIGKEVISELELGARNFGGKLVAITGTNGKTTTTRLVGNILKCAGKSYELVGNIGTPICSKIKKSRHKIFVCETSSFQLEAVKSFHPHIACLLNISEDHLDRHKTMKNYENMKYRIFEKQGKKDYAVVQNGLFVGNITSNVVGFGYGEQKNGCYLLNGQIWFDNGRHAEVICSAGEVKLLGRHNLENVMASVAICKLLKIKNKYIVRGIKTFEPSKHRLQLVKEVGNIRFFDDSKATNIDAVKQALFSMASDRKILLLLGGSEKGLSYEYIFENLPQNVKKVFAFGELSSRIVQTAKENNVQNVIGFKTLKDATYEACKVADGGCDVLLSPGSASFDEFENYADRGEKFLEYINAFYNEKVK